MKKYLFGVISFAILCSSVVDSLTAESKIIPSQKKIKVNYKSYRDNKETNVFLYRNIREKQNENPVVLFIHGWPGAPGGVLRSAFARISKFSGDIKNFDFL